MLWDARYIPYQITDGTSARVWFLPKLLKGFLNLQKILSYLNVTSIPLQSVLDLTRLDTVSISSNFETVTAARRSAYNNIFTKSTFSS